MHYMIRAVYKMDITLGNQDILRFVLFTGEKPPYISVMYYGKRIKCLRWFVSKNVCLSS